MQLVQEEREERVRAEVCGISRVKEQGWEV